LEISDTHGVKNTLRRVPTTRKRHGFFPGKRGLGESRDYPSFPPLARISSSPDRIQPPRWLVLTKDVSKEEIALLWWVTIVIMRRIDMVPDKHELKRHLSAWVLYEMKIANMARL